MDLTDLATVKEVLSIPSSETSYDAELSRLITAISAEAENFMNRYALQTERTEYVDLEHNQGFVSLKGYPIASVSSVYNDPYDWEYGSDTLVSSDDYVIYPERGLLWFWPGAVSAGPRALKITYTGGMATDTTTFISSYPDISLAVARQVAWAFNTKRHIGTTGATITGGGVEIPPFQEWQPEVKKVLRMHRRFIW